MFDLNDTRVKRRKVIFGEAQIDAQHGVLLAAVDFEWTCRRAVLALSHTPTVVLYEKFTKDYSSFSGIEKAWKTEVMPVSKDICSLPDLLNKKTHWEWVIDAMKCRNAIIHGTESRVKDTECRWAVCVLEDACDEVAEFVRGKGKSIFKRIGRARTKKELAQESTLGKRLREWKGRVGSQIDKFSESHWIRTGEIC